MSSLPYRKVTKSLSQSGGEQIGCPMLAAGVSGFDQLSR